MADLCGRLGIEVPVVQSGMGGVAGPDLAAAVSRAGGLGVLAALRLTPDALRTHIRALRQQTDRPFGVNIWLYDELLPPLPPERLDPELVARVQATLDDLRRSRDLPPVDHLPAAMPDLIPDALEVMLDERVPVFSAAVGLPSVELVERFHRVGTVVMAMVTSVDDAREAHQRGVDIIVAQGSEAGGHRSVSRKPSRADAAGTGTIVLVPAVRDALGPEVPLVAAGGIADGRGLAAALVLGADGVLLGTRFVATAESGAHPGWKAALLARERPTVLTDAVSGQWARVLRNELTDRYDEAAPGVLPSLLQASAAADLYAAAARAGDVEMMPLYAGESTALVAGLPGAAEVVAQLVAEAEQALGRPIGASASR